MLVGFFPFPAPAEPVIVQTDKVTLFVETLAEGLDHPWAVEPLPMAAC